MPLIIPNKLPAKEALQKDNIFTMENAEAVNQDIRPLKIAIVNLMPTKIATEIQLARLLANTPLQVELTLVRTDSYESKNISKEHLNDFYKTLDEIKNEKFDGMIITGAPVELLPYEDVQYWKELTELLEYSRENVYSSMFICWGAQAALYYYYGIDKHELSKKLFGVFPHKLIRSHNPLVRGFDEVFYSPHSRHTKVNKEDILKNKKLRILAESKEAGPHILSTENGREIYIMGHQEYDKKTLAGEYFRDKDAGLDIEVPKNYFEDDDPNKDVIFRWRAHASILFNNWLNYYVYQETPYNIEQIDKDK